MNGVLIIDKPAGMTSHDVVNRVRRILGERAVGHLGTLDPMATGLLPLVVGSFTRLAQFYAASEKTYEGVIRLGFSTDTYDTDGEPTSPAQPVNLNLEQLEAVAARFRGAIEQTPPPFSAKKIQGVPAYKLARKSKPVALQPVRVEVKQFEILNAENDRLTFRARVSSGTYLRSVAHDMGQRLGCGAHLHSLRRTGIAEFTLTDAHTLADLEAAVRSQKCEALWVHPRAVLPQLPSVSATDEMAARIRTGRTVNLPDFSKARQVKVFCGQRELIAIATRVAGTLFHAKLVLAAESALSRQ